MFKHNLLTVNIATVFMVLALTACESSDGSDDYSQDPTPITVNDVQFNEFIIDYDSTNKYSYSLLSSTKPLIDGSGVKVSTFDRVKGFEDGGFEDYFPNPTIVYANNLQATLKNEYLTQNVNKFTYKLPDSSNQSKELSFTYKAINLEDISLKSGQITSYMRHQSNIVGHLKNLNLANSATFPKGSFCFSLVEKTAEVPMYVQQSSGTYKPLPISKSEWKSNQISEFGLGTPVSEETSTLTIPSFDSAELLHLRFLVDIQAVEYNRYAIFAKKGDSQHPITGLDYIAQGTESFSPNTNPNKGSIECGYMNDVASNYIERTLIEHYQNTGDNDQQLTEKLPSGEIISKGQLIVHFKDGVTDNQKEALATKHSMTNREHTQFSIFISDMDIETLQATKKLLEQESLVKIVEYNGIATIA